VANRPLRQYYLGDGVAPVPMVIDPALADFVGPWRAHRARFLEELRGLDVADWDHATRCEDWSVRDVIGHLVVVDGYWPLPLTAAREAAPPTTILRGFDPAHAPSDPQTGAPVVELLDRHAAHLDALVAVIDTFDDEVWDRRCESPLGHVPARLILAHAYWDSWLHEYDIFVPLGDAPAVAREDLLAATWFSLVMAGLQGGLVADPDAVGPGPEAPIDACLAFEDLPGEPLHFAVGTLHDGLAVTRCARDHAPVPAGLAVDVVEGLTGRQAPDTATAGLPADVAAQVQRASLVF
jgi:uncharacterized protein (TIGR03083 family)